MKFSPTDPHPTANSHHLCKFAGLALATLFCSFAVAQTARPAPVAPATAPVPHPLVGTWSWTLAGKACTETWQYSAKGTRLVTSGEEVTRGDYEISAAPSAQGFYRLTDTVTGGNGKRDCSGDLHEASDPPVVRFIQFSPKQDQLIVCKAESLQACFGPLKRMPG
ncbi:hypothetical protein [Polaromonas aquatica]|uniref:hypothetical protein n=1 Tax=Polaromonas aquatica TaxID=332657 RepID=UPI003D65E208